jgi:hypothetical protein
MMISACSVMSVQTQNRGIISVKGKYKFRFTHIQTPYRDIVLFIVLLCIKRKMDFVLQIELTAQETAQRVYNNFFQCAISRTEPNSANNVLTFLLNKKDFIISSEILLYAAPYGKKWSFHNVSLVKPKNKCR